MYIFLIVVYAILSLALVGLILLQRGRGSSTGLTYDPQSSVFGSSGSVSFLVKLTTVFAVIFFALGIIIGINFRDSMSAEEQSLVEQALANEEEQDSAASVEDQAVSAPEDVPAISIDPGSIGDIPLEPPANQPSDIPSPEIGEDANTPSEDVPAVDEGTKTP